MRLVRCVAAAAAAAVVVAVAAAVVPGALVGEKCHAEAGAIVSVDEMAGVAVCSAAVVNVFATAVVAAAWPAAVTAAEK